MVRKMGIIKYDVATKSRRIPTRNDCKYNGQLEGVKLLAKKRRNTVLQNAKRERIDK